jgi:hypothetical protein
MKTENSWLERIEAAGRGALVANSQLVSRKTRTVIMPISEGNGAFVSAVPVKGSIL